MIAAIRYSVTGAEVKSSGTTLVPIPAASGYEMLDVIMNGVSQNYASDVTIDEVTGNLLFNSTLNRGDWVLAIYKTLPRSVSQVVNDFETSDFETNDFT
jgi:hypothetical protein